MVLMSARAVPTVTLRHKRKKHYIKINQSDWSQDLGKYKYSGFERVGEQHRDAEPPRTVVVEPVTSEPGEKPLEFGKAVEESPYRPLRKRKPR